MSTTRFLSLQDLNTLEPPQWLIEGMFESNSLVMLAAPPRSFKSFLAIDWMMSLASGRPWCGKSTQTVKVAYVLGEGKANLIKRLQAWIRYNNPTKEELDRIHTNFRVSFEVPQLGHKASVDNMLADVEAEGFHPEVLVIDTFARSAVGLDENDARDAGLWVEQADRLRQLGYAVIFLHHTKKNTEFGVAYRGSSAILGAMDTAYVMTREGSECLLKCDKQKDHDEAQEMRFKRVLVPLIEFGGESSCVLIQAPRVIDSRFDQDQLEIGEVIAELMEDASYPTDVARAEALAARTGLTFSAAQSRISRANK